MKVRINCVCDIDENFFEIVKDNFKENNQKQTFININGFSFCIDEIYELSVYPVNDNKIADKNNIKKSIHKLMKDNIKLYKEYFESDNINEVKQVFLDNIVDSPTLLYYFLKDLLINNHLKFIDLLYDRDIFKTVSNEFNKFVVTGIDDSEREYQESINKEFSENTYNYIRNYTELIPIAYYYMEDISKDFNSLYSELHYNYTLFNNNILIGWPHYSL